MTTVLFDNANPMMQTKLPDGSLGAAYPAEHINQSVTRIELWDGVDDPEFVNHTLSTNNDRILTLIAKTLEPDEKRYAVAIAEIEQIVEVHAGGEKPVSVSSDDEGLAKALAKYYDCDLGQFVALLTNAGRDVLHAQHLGGGGAAFNYMAVTASVTTPAATDTTLTGEITTAGGGLLRGSATYAHTAGTNTSTLTKTFTANGSDSLPVTLAQIGIFNAASGVTLGYHTAMSSTATLTTSGDNTTVTWTDTAG